MNAFRVWLRPLGDLCCVGVDGLANARWLLGRLSESIVCKTTPLVVQQDGSSYCSFQVPFRPPLSRSKFEKLLAAIPEVKLMLEPASRSEADVGTGTMIRPEKVDENKALNITVHF